MALLLLLFVQVTAQTIEDIEIKVKKLPLNQVLLELKENYGFQFAFDNDLLSNYLISANKTFKTQEEAIHFLTKNLPLDVEKSGKVFLIMPEKEEQEPESFQISGQVLAARTYEPLPYSYILVNRRPVQSDLNGHFNYIASADSVLSLQISHLGYFVYDTIVTQSINRTFFLYPQMETIKEVQVYSNPVEKSTLIGDMAGRMKINHQIAPVLPGHGDNSVFNLLRLMPGILASGESSNDLIIWGAYESHSKIQFDGITLFGLKNFNDNISVVNPFMVKNIEVLKGGYDARYGERVGGIVDIQGKDGTISKPTFTFNINSTTVNSMVQVPLSKKSTLIGAYRQTYYQIYDPTSIKWFRKKGANNSNNNTEDNSEAIDLEVLPEFLFRDVNLKYTFKGDNGSRLGMSFYGGGDRFSYGMEGVLGRNTFIRSEEEENLQFGVSFQFSQPWKNGDVTNLNVSYSHFERQMFEFSKTENSRWNTVKISKENDSENKVNELNFVAEHTLNFNRGHKLQIGIGFTDNRVRLVRYSLDGLVFDYDNESPRIYGYLNNILPVGDNLVLTTGLRTIYVSELEKWYFEPRASASLNVVDGLKVNASWGWYNQFLSKTTVVDSSYNHTHFWTNSDDVDIPVLSAEHYVGGISFNKKGFTLSTEAFFKTTEGLNRFFNGNKRIDRGFYEGKAEAYGVDVFLKQEYKNHMAWVSYTWSNVEENFPFYLRDNWQPSPQHQEHEVKFATVLNYKRFYLSANYVYGSGFERYDIETNDGTEFDQPYSRLDAALVYKFKPGKIKAEAGISILNVLDTNNIKYSNINVSYIDEINLVGIYADAVPFTPSLFLKIEL